MSTLRLPYQITPGCAHVNTIAALEKFVKTSRPLYQNKSKLCPCFHFSPSKIEKTYADNLTKTPAARYNYIVTRYYIIFVHSYGYRMQAIFEKEGTIMEEQAVTPQIPNPVPDPDPTSPSTNPSPGFDPTSPSTNPSPGLDPTSPGPNPSPGLDPTSPDPNPFPGLDPTSPGPNPSPGFDPTNPASNPH